MMPVALQNITYQSFVQLSSDDSASQYASQQTVLKFIIFHLICPKFQRYFSNYYGHDDEVVSKDSAKSDVTQRNSLVRGIGVH